MAVDVAYMRELQDALGAALVAGHFTDHADTLAFDEGAFPEVVITRPDGERFVVTIAPL